MKRIFLMFAAIVALLAVSSGYNDHNYGSSIGQTAPEIAVANKTEQLTLTQLRGHKVLVAFWNSSDAASREQNKRYSQWADTQTNVEYIGINLDDAPEVFRGILALDGISADRQFSLAGTQAEALRRAYRLDNTLGALLIDESGRVEAVNPGV